MDKLQFGRIAKALSDPRRFEILELIARRGDLGCQQLCACVELSQPTVSHHLKELANAGLVSTRREGQFVYCEVAYDVMAAYLAELDRRILQAGARRA